MSNEKKIVILYNKIENNTPDELDVLHQVALVEEACENLGHEVICMTVGKNLSGDIIKLKVKQADLVFNLVESIWGLSEIIYFAPALLNSLKIPFSGVPLEALFITTNKVLAKKMMRFNNLPTADFFAIDELHQLNPGKTYIAKPIWEDASVGITEDFIFNISEKEKFDKIKQLAVSHYFVEEFIEGREFNVSILTHKNGPEVLPLAEMIFSGYFNDKPKIVGYKAKWDEKSEEYKQMNRAFETLKNDPELERNLIEICEKTWKAFNLKGYARIDFRVDKNNNIFILEINGNPCISPDSGFVAAVEFKGYNVKNMVGRIIQDLN